MDQNKLVKLITQEIIKKLAAEPVQELTEEVSRPQVLVIMTGGSIGFSQSVKSLASIEKWAELKVILSQNAAQIYTRDLIFPNFKPTRIYHSQEQTPVKEILQDVKAVIVPVLTLNSAAKLAAGICDNLVLNIIMNSLLTDIPVIAARNAASLRDEERKKIIGGRSNPGLVQLTNDNLRKLEVMGIKLADAAHLEEPTRKAVFPPNIKKYGDTKKREIITSEKISNQDIEQGYIYLPKNALLTPLSKDIVSSHNLKVYYQENS